MNQSIAFDPQQVGVVKRHPDGFGFFVPDNPAIPDVYIPGKFMGSVMTNDRVKIHVKPEPGGSRFRGEVLEILERSMTHAVGQLHIVEKNYGWINDESKGWGIDLKVTHFNGLPVKEGEWVQIEIKTYPDSSKGFTGVVHQIIGDPIDPQTDSIRALAMHSIPSVFSSEVLKQAEQLPTEVTAEDRVGREDLTAKPLITIDGETAKDFDDAIYVEPHPKGFTLYVAIADVSHYVKPGSPIDGEAVKRGTSTYFPGFVNPMLPEALSNEMCSLKPKVDRLALVAQMHISFDGELLSAQVYEAVIHSHARVTYGQAQEIIDGNDLTNFSHVKQDILRARDLAKILMTRRMREGSLELDVPETVIEVDGTGMPVDIIRSERLFAHRLIEEMMLMANVAVAKYLVNKEVDVLFRIHEPPDELAIDILKNYLAAQGVQVKTSQNLQKSLTKALKEFEGKPQATVLNILTLRSMNQAKYSPANVGHFGLGFDDYAHFTSPIRRYPDLIVHRHLKSVIYPEKGYVAMDRGDLETAGVVLSAAEQRSVKAERFVDSVKKARFMEQYVGETFTGMISSVTKFGVFVVLRQFNVDGLVRIEELASEALEFDEENLCLVGRKSGHTIKIGDELDICVAGVNIDEGQIDFSLAGADPEARKRKPQKGGQGRSSSSKNHRGALKTKGAKGKYKESKGSSASQAKGQPDVVHDSSLKPSKGKSLMDFLRNKMKSKSEETDEGSRRRSSDKKRVRKSANSSGPSKTKSSDGDESPARPNRKKKSAAHGKNKKRRANKKSKKVKSNKGKKKNNGKKRQKT